ncbi:hypothetical protein LTR28_002777 [Elasticomyces elasticus]|nr:hypothetical protein LTR28_002777 [Elasticomyces elasticus]
MSSRPFKVKAVYEYSSPHEDDLNFPNGQIITVTEEEGDDWYMGEYTDVSGAKKEGLFPRNFVEKYEPEIPSRPARAPRPRSEIQPAAPTTPKQPAPQAVGHFEDQTQTTSTYEPQLSVVTEPSGNRTEGSIKSPTAPEPEADLPPAPKPAHAVPATKTTPLPVVGKPNSFKDRIAAFNKGTAAPIAPFKPGAPPGGFVKKPFVAPPPSKNAYVPPPRADVVPKIYKRDEDPEIAARQAQDQLNAEKAGLTTGSAQVAAPEGVDGEDAPQLSLKDRIAAIQKSQMEQAMRKEKPKKPAKKRTGSSENIAALEAEDVGSEHATGGEYAERQPPEMPREEPRTLSAQRPPQASLATTVETHEPEIFSDGNDADQSAAGETTEDNEGPDDSDEVARVRTQTSLPRAAGAFKEEPDVGDENDTMEGETEEDDMDEETRRKLALRERMAKMSGGMGMPGMFGPPVGMPMPMPGGGALKNQKSVREKVRRRTDESENARSSSPPQTQRVPMVPVPGMQHVRSPESRDRHLELGKEDESEQLIASEHEAEGVPDMEDLKSEPAPRVSVEGGGVPPPMPQDFDIGTVRQFLDLDGPFEIILIAEVLKRPVPPLPTFERVGAPPVPTDRPVPRLPAEARAVPPPPPPTAAPLSPSAGSESDDEMSLKAKRSSGETMATSIPGLPTRGMAPPPPTVPGRPQGPRSPQSPPMKRASYFGSDPASPVSPTTPGEKRSSRIPPFPISSPITSPAFAQSRPPPPPPPTAAPPSRQSTLENGPHHLASSEVVEGESEYEGDYDTDIASGATHKEALKAHIREPSLTDSITADDRSSRLAPQTPSFPPPIPAVPTPRAVPPPPPSHQPPKTRASLDVPRAAPPPVPQSRDAPTMQNEDSYDPYRYTEQTRRYPTNERREAGESPEDSSDDLYSASPPRGSLEQKPPLPGQAPPLPRQERSVPPPPSHQASPHAPTPSRAPPRQSLDVQKTPTVIRHSMDQAGPSGDHGYIATDVDLAERSQWWAQPEHYPPVFQHRSDILCEMEESSTSKRGGKTTISKDVYVLFIDYSQTVITARYDSRDVSDATLEQRHEPPPPRLRQDQLEDAWQRYGTRIAEGAARAKDSVVGDGSPHALVLQLVKPLRDALLPVGTRAYGHLIYANMGNSSVQQFDEIRPGDIITLRNVKLQGKHGGLHQRYNMDVGMLGAAGGPGHVAVVHDWDGTKKKVRAWEQGREKGKVRMESFRLGDLKSGEVKVWRVVGRGWVGWEGGS